MKIKTKMIINAIVIPGVIVALLLTSYLFRIHSEQKYEDIMRREQVVAYNMKSIQQLIFGISNDERGYLLTRDEQYIELLKKKEDEITGLIQQINQLMDKSNAQTGKEFKAFEEGYNKYTVGLQSILTSAGYGSRNDSFVPFADLLDKYDEERAMRKIFDAQVEGFVNGQNQAITSKIQQAHRTMLITTVLQTGIGLAVIIYSILQSIILIKSIRPLYRMNDQLLAMAEGGGDLSSRLANSSKDEIGMIANAYNKLIGGFREVIISAQATAESVAGSAERVSQSAKEVNQATRHTTVVMEDVASGMEKQVDDIIHTTAVVKEIAKGLSTISVTGQQVSELSAAASEGAGRGGQSINQAMQQMEKISSSVISSSEAVRLLDGQAEQISMIGTVITGIAKQTGMLALNASIEAARAGEQGRGFAVVASEVKILAEQVSVSAAEITTVVRSIQQSVGNVVTTMQAGTDEVKTGIQVMETVGASFRQIETSIQQVNEQIQNVSTGVEEMSAGSDQLVDAVERIRIVAEQSSAGTQSVSATAEQQLASMEEVTNSSLSLSDMAQKLKAQVGGFQV